MSDPTTTDREAARYDPSSNDYRLADDPRCLYGWKGRNCRHRFGHGCFRALGHRGLCMDDPHDDACAKVRRPKDWDQRGRAEANR